MALIVVAKLSEIPDGGVKGVVLGSKQIGLYRIGNEIFALSDVCTHEACIISENHDTEGDVVQCTCHGSKFNIKTGELVGPPAAEPLLKYTVKIEGEEVLVDV